TEIGTQQVAVLGEDQGLIPAMAALDDDTLVFTDELGMLWVSDGTGAGTQAIGSEVFAQGSFEPHEPAFTVFNGVGYFIGELNDDWRLWRTDGTLVGTTLVLPNSQPWPLSVFNGSLYYQDLSQIWISDGTEMGAVSLGLDLISSGLGIAGTRYFFSRNSLATDTELWSTDGTLAGSHLVYDVFQTPNSNGPERFTVGPAHHYWRITSSGQNSRRCWVDGCRSPS